MIIGKHSFDLDHKSYLMGILNLTPDSFSDGGAYATVDDALKMAEKMVEDGASIIDIGGESTRPGHVKITEQEELERVIPVIERIHKEIDVTIVY